MRFHNTLIRCIRVATTENRRKVNESEMVRKIGKCQGIIAVCLENQCFFDVATTYNSQ